MSLERRMRRSRGGQRLRWGVVEVHQEMPVGPPVWVAFWIQLGGRGTVSVETDLVERANNICRDAWLRARHGLGPPAEIVVLDDETARRVRAAVPASVPVVIEEHPTLRHYRDAWADADHEKENTHSFFN